MAYNKTIWENVEDGQTVTDEFPIDENNLNKIENGIYNNTIWQSATCIDLSDYSLELDNWNKIDNSLLNIVFDAAIQDQDATLTINEDESVNIVDKNGNALKGSTVENQMLLLRFDGVNFVAFAGGSGSGGGDSIPLGSIFDYEGDTLPPGYEWTDGQEGRPLYISNGIIDIESGEETFLGYKIDGKWAYAKRINIGTLPNATTETIAHGLTLNNINIIDVITIASDASTIINIPYVTAYNNSTGTSNISVDITQNYISVFAGIDRSSFSAFTTIYYTKIVDEFMPQYKIIKTVKTSIASIGDTLPIGVQMPFAGINVPEDWLLCDGAELSRTDYRQLFNVIGTSYGVGDGSTTFNLPDKRGRVSVGMDNSQTEFATIGEKGGEKEHTLTVSELAAHNHNGLDAEDIAIPRKNYITNGTDLYTLGTSGYGIGELTVAGSNQPHNNLQPYEVDNWIIKVKISVAVTADVEDNLESTNTNNALSANQGRLLNETITGTELYNNANGNSGTITLSDTAENYDFFEIYYKNNYSDSNECSSLKVDSPNGKKVQLCMSVYANALAVFIDTATISGTQITQTNNGYYNGTNMNAGGFSSSLNILITRVIGHKNN